jgi:hypothetical protein
VTPDAARSASYRVRRNERRAAGWLDDPVTVAWADRARQDPALASAIPMRDAMASLRVFASAWFGRGLAWVPPDQLDYMGPVIVHPEAVQAVVAAFPAFRPVGSTFEMVGEAVRAGVAVLDRLGATVRTWMAQHFRKPRRPVGARRLERAFATIRAAGLPAPALVPASPRSLPPSRTEESSSRARPGDTVDSRIAWHPPSERPRGDLVPLSQLMPGIAEHFKNRAGR